MTDINTSTLEADKAFIAGLDFAQWLMADNYTVQEQARLFRAAFARVAEAEDAAQTKRDENPSYITALAELNARYPWLEQYRADLKQLNAEYGSSMSDDLALAKLRYNSTARIIKDAAWGTKVLATITNDGKERKPRSK